MSEKFLLKALNLMGEEDVVAIKVGPLHVLGCRVIIVNFHFDNHIKVALLLYNLKLAFCFRVT
jgi:hypothetical protein